MSKIIEFPNKKYNLIYADPPWKVPARAYSRGEKIEDYYPVMETSSISALPISSICKPDCWLYLWIVDMMLPDSLEVMKAWGFIYKKSFIWDKISIGLGNYNRGQHEQLLIGKRGKPQMPSLKNLQSSVVNIKRTTHSIKPSCFRTIIEKHHPDISKIELFARDNAFGWDAWGNELVAKTNADGEIVYKEEFEQESLF